MKYDSTVCPVVQVDFPSGGLSSGPPGGSSQLERRLPPMDGTDGKPGRPLSRLEDSNVSVPRPDNDGRRDPGLRTMPRRFPWLGAGGRLHLVGSTRNSVVLNSFDNDARGLKRGKTRSRPDVAEYRNTYGPLENP